MSEDDADLPDEGDKEDEDEPRLIPWSLEKVKSVLEIVWIVARLSKLVGM